MSSSAADPSAARLNSDVRQRHPTAPVATSEYVEDVSLEQQQKEADAAAASRAKKTYGKTPDGTGKEILRLLLSFHLYNS